MLSYLFGQEDHPEETERCLYIVVIIYAIICLNHCRGFITFCRFLSVAGMDVRFMYKIERDYFFLAFFYL